MRDPHPLTNTQLAELRSWPKEAEYNRLPVAADPRPTYQEMVSLHQAYWRCINEGADEANVCAVPGKSNCRCWIKPSRNCRCPWILPVARVARLSPRDPWRAAILIDDDSEPGGIRALKRWDFIPQWPSRKVENRMDENTMDQRRVTRVLHGNIYEHVLMPDEHRMNGQIINPHEIDRGRLDEATTALPPSQSRALTLPSAAPRSIVYRRK